MTSRPRDPEAGFTLAETLVALTVLGLAFGLGIDALSGGLDWLGRAGRRQRATAVAETILARVGHDIALRDGMLQGGDGKYLWTLEIVPSGGYEDVPRGHLAGHVVTVGVVPPGMRPVRLTTLRLAPRAADR